MISSVGWSTRFVLISFFFVNFSVVSVAGAERAPTADTPSTASTGASAGAVEETQKKTDLKAGLKTEFHIRKFETSTLKNGLLVLWVPDPGLPYIDLLMMIKSGSSQDPKGKEGLASFTASMLQRGTAKRSSVQISEDLEQIGSGFEAGTAPDYTTVGVSSLSFDKDNLLKQFAEIVLHPSFTHSEIERYRKLVLAGLQKLSDEPEQFTEYLMAGFIFGAHPYGHESIGTSKSVRALKRIDLQHFYNSHFTPENAVLAVVGQYDDAWKENVVATFEGWSNEESKAHDEIVVPDFPQWKGREILLVDRDDLTQAQIQIGFKGVPRNIPDFLEMRAAVKILGEANFGSRLFDEIRVKRALTYHIGSWFDPREKAGPMGIYTFTRNDKIGETVQETLNAYKLFVEGGVTDAEVDEIKALMRGQFPRIVETPEALGDQLLILNRYGVSPEYLSKYLDHLQAMTKASINATIHKYFDPDNLRILVYAPRAQAEAALRKLGPLEVKSYRDYLQ